MIKLAIYIFSCGLAGAIYNYRNYLIAAMALELTYLGVISVILFYSTTVVDIEGPVAGLAALAVTASESALGLGIFVLLFKYVEDISFEVYQVLHG